MRTFVIGDVHGHSDRLAKLIDRAGAFAPDVEIVLLGDIGHYGKDTHENDLTTWQFVEKLRYYYVANSGAITCLWGNHDYANVHPELHSFRGHDMWYPEVKEIVQRMEPRFAVERAGFLLTHAGLSPRFAAPPGTAIEMVAEIINACEGQPVINDIGYRRGGTSPQGGVLWRAEAEPLAEIPQVFGHSRGDIRRFGPNNQSWCIDVGDKTNDSLAGLWLDTRKIVAVGPDAEMYETPWEDSD